MKFVTLLLLSVTLGCARKAPQPEVWVFRTCVHNVDHQVCECKQSFEEVEAKTGRRVKVCL